MNTHKDSFFYRAVHSYLSDLSKNANFFLVEPPALRSVRNPRKMISPDLCLNLNNTFNIAFVVVTESKNNNPPKMRSFHLDPIISSLLSNRATFGVLIIEDGVSTEYTDGKNGAKTLLDDFTEFKSKIFLLKFSKKQTNIIRGYYREKGNNVLLSLKIKDIDDMEILFTQELGKFTRRIASRVLEPPVFSAETYRILCYLRRINRNLGNILYDTEISDFLSFIYSHETDLGIEYNKILLSILQDLRLVADFSNLAKDVLSDYTLILENYVSIIYQICPELNPLLSCTNLELNSGLIPKLETRKIRNQLGNLTRLNRKVLIRNKYPFYGLLVKQKWILELVYCRNKGYNSAENPTELENNYYSLVNFLGSDSEFKNEFSCQEISLEPRALAISLLLRNYHHHKNTPTILIADEMEFRNAVDEITKSFLIIYRASMEVCSSL